MKNSNQMFEVTKIQLHTGLEGFNSPDSYGVYKTTGGSPLGVVGKDYTPTQPKFLYDNFQACLVSKEIDDSQMKFREIKGGRKIIISSPVQQFEFKNQAKKGDVLSFEVALSTGYDGRTVTSMFINVERLICTNGMKAINTEFQVSFKNVKGNIGKANMLCEDIDASIRGIDSLKETYKALSQREISAKEQRQYILDVTGMDVNQYADYTKRKQSVLDQINESVAIEMKDAGSTAWALLNGITRYTNHMANFASKDDYIYADTGMFMNNRAQQHALQFLN